MNDRIKKEKFCQVTDDNVSQSVILNVIAAWQASVALCHEVVLVEAGRCVVAAV